MKVVTLRDIFAASAPVNELHLLRGVKYEEEPSLAPSHYGLTGEAYRRWLEYGSDEVGPDVSRRCCEYCEYLREVETRNLFRKRMAQRYAYADAMLEALK